MRGVGYAALMACIALRCTPGFAEPARASVDRDIFMDVVVGNRFFERGHSIPTISVRLSRDASLHALVYDRVDRLVAHVAADAPAARHRLALPDVPPVPRGEYRFCLAALDPSGERVGVYPRRPGGGQIVKAVQYGYDANAKLIWYVLPRASYVRIRAGIKQGPFLEPVQNWLAQAAGRHELTWDGSSADGVFRDLHLHPGIRTTVLAVSLPVNVVVARGDAALRTPGQRGTDEVALPTEVADLATPPWQQPGDADADDKQAWVVDDYRLRLDAVEDAPGTAKVRVSCHPEDRARLMNERFEIMLFLDTIFLMEDERSQLPFTYRFATRGVAPGRHIVSANTVDTQGNLGTASVELVVSGTRR